VLAVRVGLPAGIVAVGIGLAALGRDDAVVGAGVALVGVGMLVALLNVLMRLGIESGADRDREDEARRYYGQHGRWPERR
jgi:hypothetical protein